MKPDIRKEIEEVVDYRLTQQMTVILVKMEHTNDQLDVIHEDLLELKALSDRISKLELLASYAKGALFALTSLIGYGMVKIAPVFFG